MSNPGTTNLVAWWAHESGALTVDSHGSNTLTNHGATGGSAKVGTGAGQYTSASNQYQDIADNAALSLGPDSECTIAGWYLLDSVGTTTRLLFTKRGSTRISYSVAYFGSDFGGPNRFACQFGNGITESASLAATSLGLPVAGTWYYIIAWHDPAANTVNIQVNDGAVDSVAWAGGTYDSADPVRLSGLGASGIHHNGRMDEISLWKRVLTSAERTWLYNAGAGRSYAEVATSASAVAKILQAHGAYMGAGIGY